MKSVKNHFEHSDNILKSFGPILPVDGPLQYSLMVSKLL